MKEIRKQIHKTQCDCPDPNCILKTACGVKWLDDAFQEYEEVVIGNEEVLAMRNILPLKRRILALLQPSQPAEGELVECQRLACDGFCFAMGDICKDVKIEFCLFKEGSKAQRQHMIAQGYVKLPSEEQGWSIFYLMHTSCKPMAEILPDLHRILKEAKLSPHEEAK